MEELIKRIYILAYSLLLAFPASLYAQDLIVTNNGDSFNCKITKVKNEEVYFSYRYKNEIISTWLRLEKIEYCQFNYFEQAEVPVEKILANKIYPRFRLALHGGYAYRTVRLHPNTPSDLVKYEKKLRFGFTYGLDFSYYLSQYLGVGVGYNAFLTQNKIANRKIFTDGHYKDVGEVSNDSRIDFIGAFIHSRKLSINKKRFFSCGLGIGYLEYNDKETAYSQSLTIEGATVGLCGVAAYDITIYKPLCVGFQLSYVFGFLPQAKVNNGYRTDILSLNKNLCRAEFSVGLRLNLKQHKKIG